MPRGMVLEKYGTKLMQLKPASILQAAHADLKLRERKRQKKADPEERYSFARKHVNRATSAAHLIALAYFDEKPLKTDKRSTFIVYGDRPLLRETLVQLLATEMLDG